MDVLPQLPRPSPAVLHFTESDKKRIRQQKRYQNSRPHAFAEDADCSSGLRCMDYNRSCQGTSQFCVAGCEPASIEPLRCRNACCRLAARILRHRPEIDFALHWHNARSFSPTPSERILCATSPPVPIQRGSSFGAAPEQPFQHLFLMAQPQPSTQL